MISLIIKYSLKTLLLAAYGIGVALLLDKIDEKFDITNRIYDAIYN